MVSLVNAGYRASEVGSMPDDRLHLLLESIVGFRGNATEGYFISQLIAAGLSYDEATFRLAHLIQAAYALGASGTQLKDDSDSLPPMLESA